MNAVNLEMRPEVRLEAVPDTSGGEDVAGDVAGALAATEAGSAGPADRARTAALVLEHLGLADALARRHRVPGHDFEDIRQVARMGLVMAAQRYREGAGHGFVQFAVPTISGTIKRYLRDQSWVVRPPRSLQELRLGVKEARGRLVQELGREPSLAELGEAAGCSPEQAAEARSLGAAMGSVQIESLDSSGEDDGARPARVLPVVDPGFEQVEERQMVSAALEGATDFERRLLKLRFVDEMSQREIGVELGVSQMQVSRLLGRLLDRMRRNLAA
ncbi:RNA polymerase sigma-B factor [Sinomonas atrocyanea]|uniref:sigma-70 family RNA polymerase sigma factor n=1 Tax=Sinomonas atrocyanea TaxID=37927 RepID=UPI002782F711|nr:sigma-70 family RNA polymerase sigma factor [Sinomonas atrocyanea]MDP9882554.1 RNA polymerase sigma-B factor [Sinomonas atrocyanea]